MIAEITAIISVIIALISLIVSIKVYNRDTPKLHIEIISPKYNCFFGDAVTGNEDRVRKSRISGINILLRNSSNAKIEVQSIVLKIKNDLFRLIPATNPYWHDVTFTNESENEDIDYNYSINYYDKGIILPCDVNAYSFIEGCVLFYNFPTKIKKKTHAQLVVNTAIGVVRKKVIMQEYDKTFERFEMEDVKQYYASLEEKQ